MAAQLTHCDGVNLSSLLKQLSYMISYFNQYSAQDVIAQKDLPQSQLPGLKVIIRNPLIQPQIVNNQVNPSHVILRGCGCNISLQINNRCQKAHFQNPNQGAIQPQIVGNQLNPPHVILRRCQLNISLHPMSMCLINILF